MCCFYLLITHKALRHLITPDLYLSDLLLPLVPPCYLRSSDGSFVQKSRLGQVLVW